MSWWSGGDLHLHRAVALDEGGVDAAGFLQHLDLETALEDFLPDDAQLHFGQAVADAAVDAEAEIEQLDNQVRMYEGIGRMFVLSDKTKIMANLEHKSKQCENKMANLEKTKEYLEKSLKDSENSLRELISAKQGKK
jgi:chaperonin cofactor prefoldin